MMNRLEFHFLPLFVTTSILRLEFLHFFSIVGFQNGQGVIGAPHCQTHKLATDTWVNFVVGVVLDAVCIIVHLFEIQIYCFLKFWPPFNFLGGWAKNKGVK